ncbi:MAG TPA: dTDP-4-dehydrorhamnose 3,5-epimerase [Candidatus Saccharimonadales bacterium]|nr:dTDP-4-dehydrorhamnose 3,5-epimerase [Candidatus Saccharimonadales bacterium]
MQFKQTNLSGAYLIELERHSDERGFFARTFCRNELSALSLETTVEQCSTSFNSRRGTLRGMHFQTEPHEEVKLVRCTRGSIFDVIIDLRPDSPTVGQHFAATLSPDNGQQLYIPRGFAHGFLTLEDNTEVFYQISNAYAPQAGRGVRWNDPAFSIPWPAEVLVISERDRAYPDFSVSVTSR